MKTLTASLLLAFAISAPAFADDADEAGTEQAEDEELESIRRASELPVSAQKLRRAGADEGEVKGAIEAGKKSQKGADRTQEAIEVSAEATEENGPVDNLGAFVQTQLDSGLRGQELAAAIHAEHEARGKGKGYGKDKHAEKHAEKNEAKQEKSEAKQEAKSDKAESKGKSADKGKPDDKGKSSDKGKPDDKGKPTEAKKSGDSAKTKGADSAKKGGSADKGKK